MVQNLEKEALDDISMDDFTTMLSEMKKTTNMEDLHRLEAWKKENC